MIILSLILLLISIMLQGIISNYFGYIYDSITLFSTVYVLITLLILNPYFENKKKYFALLIIAGLIMDITYTDIFLLNTCLFMVSYYLSKTFHFFFPYNWITISISNLLSIFTYHIITFIFLTLLSYDSYTIWTLLKILTHSILMTIIYSNIIYTIVTFINTKFQLKEVK